MTYLVGVAAHRAANGVAVAEAVSGQRAEDDREIHDTIEGSFMSDVGDCSLLKLFMIATMKVRVPVKFVAERQRRESYEILTFLGLGLAIRDAFSEFKLTQTALKYERFQV